MTDRTTVSSEVSRRALLQSTAGSAALAALASACSASTSGGGAGGGTAGSLTFMSTQFTPVEERQKYEGVLKKYAPGVGFNPVDGGVFPSTIKSQLAAGKVQINLVGGLHGDLAPFADQLEDLSSVAQSLSSAGYAKDILDLAKLGTSATRYIPWMQASYVVAVNKKALQWLPSGADVNKLTYDQYLAWAKAAKAANGGKGVFGHPAGPKGLHHRFYQGFLLPSFTGGQMTTFMSDGAVQAWTYMRELWGAMNPASTNYDFMQEPLARGEVMVAWDHVARLVGAVGDKPDEWQMVPAPTGPKGLGYMLVVAGLGILKGAPDKDRAIEVIRKLSTPEAQIDTLRSNAFFPVVKADPPSDLPAGAQLEAKAVAAQQNAAKAVLALPPVGLGAKDGEVGQLFKNCFQQICLSNADIKSTLTAQGQQLETILAGLKVPCWAPDPMTPGQVCKVG
ncbi:MAG: extracellular solute-binding protein [Lapillicoccus sp.]